MFPTCKVIFSFVQSQIVVASFTSRVLYIFHLIYIMKWQYALITRDEFFLRVNGLEVKI